MATRGTDSEGQAPLFDLNGLLHPKWEVRCWLCRRYYQSAPTITLARIKARRHLDKYGHTVVARLSGTDVSETFTRKYEVEDVDTDIPPY